MALEIPALTEHVGSNAAQLNLMAVSILNLVNFTNHLEGQLEAVKAELASLEVVDEPATAAASTRKTTPAK